MTFWDTADVYGAAANERLLARFLTAGRRDEITLATKFGGVLDDDGNMTMDVRGEAARLRPRSHTTASLSLLFARRLYRRWYIPLGAVATLAAGALTTLSPTTTLEAAAGRARPGLPAIPAGTGATGAVPAALATGAVGGTIPTEAVG